MAVVKPRKRLKNCQKQPFDCRIPLGGWEFNWNSNLEKIGSIDLCLPLPSSLSSTRLQKAQTRGKLCRHTRARVLPLPPSLCTKCADADAAVVLEFTQTAFLVAEYVGQTR
jgi:hypothetical protein